MKIFYPQLFQTSCLQTFASKKNYFYFVLPLSVISDLYVKHKNHGKINLHKFFTYLWQVG